MLAKEVILQRNVWHQKQSRFPWTEHPGPSTLSVATEFTLMLVDMVKKHK